MCDGQTLCRIFSLHCKSFYGCEILTICHICLICMFRGAKLFVTFLDCLRACRSCDLELHQHVWLTQKRVIMVWYGNFFLTY